MAVNKVVFGAVSIMDITDSTVTPEKLAEGETAYDKSGEKITGTMESLDTSDATASESEVLAGETFYANGEKKTGTMPSHNINDNEVAWRLSSVPPTGGDASMVVDIPEGHYEGGAYPIGTLAMYQPKNVTPGTSDIQIPGGAWFMNGFTVKGDSDLKPENIAEGVEIFGVVGTHAGGSTEDLSEEINDQTAKLEILGMAITELEQELEGKASGANPFQSCTVNVAAGSRLLSDTVIVYTALDGTIVSTSFSASDTNATLSVAKNTIMYSSTAVDSIAKYDIDTSLASYLIDENVIAIKSDCRINLE